MDIQSRKRALAANTCLHLDLFSSASSSVTTQRPWLTDVRCVAQQVTKQPIPSHLSYLIFEIVCDDADGNDVEVPFVAYKLKK